ncbi:hypothetical protein GUJ93_ZPchr0012g22204 [Zizania palustris]|uniref:Leucine-rich repeat-containing N-terminal plant-type domain-containing protein n=1 Tax=Zizania palustris TaxID=103762 RepID=A0A8J5WP75_ZIZPA|nr:hypothetical protein GUJ93_ZPchr0012g22204 [Zizania palustris]
MSFRFAGIEPPFPSPSRSSRSTLVLSSESLLSLSPYPAPCETVCGAAVAAATASFQMCRPLSLSPPPSLGDAVGETTLPAPTASFQIYRSLSLSPPPALGARFVRGSVADIAVLAGACGGLKTLNLSGDAVGAEKVDGDGDLRFASPDSLDLSNNKITGDSGLRWMVGAVVGAVRWLDLSFNKISGAFPEFTNCSRLQYLDMSSNHFFGEFPPDITGLASLKALNLSNNNFFGELPADAFTGLQQLTTLSLSLH